MEKLMKELALVSGAVSITAGFALLHPAAGMIVGGVLVIVGVVLASIGGGVK